jgi:hypothetical protein
MIFFILNFQLNLYFNNFIDCLNNFDLLIYISYLIDHKSEVKIAAPHKYLSISINSSRRRVSTSNVSNHFTF